MVIPNSVTSIEFATFYGCSSLTSVEIPNSVTSIGEAAFCDCSNLETIIIPKGVARIGERAFLGCIFLTNITCLIPADKIFAISPNVFENKISKTLYVPKGAKWTYKETEGWYGFQKTIELK